MHANPKGTKQSKVALKKNCIGYFEFALVESTSVLYFIRVSLCFFFLFSSSLELKFTLTSKIIFIKPAIPLPYSDFFSDFSDSQRNSDVKTTLDASRIVACKYIPSDKLSAN